MSGEGGGGFCISLLKRIINYNLTFGAIVEMHKMCTIPGTVIGM